MATTKMRATSASSATRSPRRPHTPRGRPHTPRVRRALTKGSSRRNTALLAVDSVSRWRACTGSYLPRAPVRSQQINRRRSGQAGRECSREAREWRGTSRRRGTQELPQFTLPRPLGFVGSSRADAMPPSQTRSSSQRLGPLPIGRAVPSGRIGLAFHRGERHRVDDCRRPEASRGCTQ